MYLRQSTASQEILLGRFVDATDADSEETGLTIANTDIKIWKHGATTLADKNSGGATHIANGLYSAVLDATDSNTLGNLEVHVHVAGARSVERTYVVLPAAIYDGLIAGTTAQPTGVPSITADPFTIVAWLLALSANPILQTTTLQTLRNRADSTDIADAPITVNTGVDTTRGAFS